MRDGVILETPRRKANAWKPHLYASRL